jgi:hypothetical protein
MRCIVAGLDDRLKVAVPVYGCGFIHENSAWVPTFKKMSAPLFKTWVGNFEPSRFVGQAKMPVLFVNGTNDFAYSLDSYQKTYRLVKDRSLCVTVNLPHSHPAGWAPVEIGPFVDQHLKAGTPLPRIDKASRAKDRIEATFRAEKPVREAALHYTSDRGPWQSRKWKSEPIKIEGTTLRAPLPDARPLVYFVTITDERKATASTEHEELPE